MCISKNDVTGCYMFAPRSFTLLVSEHVQMEYLMSAFLPYFARLKQTPTLLPNVDT